jgi:hypothetical protein
MIEDTSAVAESVNKLLPKNAFCHIWDIQGLDYVLLRIYTYVPDEDNIKSWTIRYNKSVFKGEVDELANRILFDFIFS